MVESAAPDLASANVDSPNGEPKRVEASLTVPMGAGNGIPSESLLAQKMHASVAGHTAAPQPEVPKAPPRLSTLGEERVWHPRRLRSVYILGMGISLIDYFGKKYSDPRMGEKAGEEIWVVNAAAFSMRHHVSFNIHDFAQDVFLQDWYAPTHDRPVVTCRAMPNMPFTYEYPMAEVVAAFADNYFQNTVGYMIAFAMLCQVENISLYGCDYNYTRESGISSYEAGRCNVEYWAGIAKARGINITSAPSSTLMDMPDRINHGLYGYGNCQPMAAIHPQTGRPVLTHFLNFDPNYKRRPVDEIDITKFTPSSQTAEFQDRQSRGNGQVPPGR